MKYGAVLAGGVGSRIGSLDYPKQFYVINEKPIIIYTIQKLVNSDLLDYIYVAIVKDYYDYMRNLLEEYNLTTKVRLIVGGQTRMETIDNVIHVIRTENVINADDIILIHDAVRPFITNKIIANSIEGAKKYGAVVATLPATDTIVASRDENVIDFIPNRKELFYGQSPDTFNLMKFIEMENNLSQKQKEIITGTSQVCTLNNQEIHIIPGDPINFKITTDLDLLIAEAIIKGGYHEENRKN